MTRGSCLAATLALVACGASFSPPRTSAPLPVATAIPVVKHELAARHPSVHEYFGTRVVDDYEWMESADLPEVKAWNDVEKDLARRYFEALPDRARVHQRLEQLYTKSSADYLALHHVVGTLFILEQAPPKQQPILVTRNEAADATSERVVLDPNVLDPSGKTTIDFFVPSPNGKLVAVSLSKNGSESGDLHVFDVASGKETSEVIARVHGGTAGGSLAWNADGSGFYYTRYPRAGEKPAADLDFHQEAWFHKLGTPESKDVYAIGKEFPRIAEIELVRSDDGRTILARVANGDGGDIEHHVLPNANGKWIRLSKFEDEIGATTFGADGKVYAVSRKGSPRGRVIAFAPPFDKAPEAILAEGDGVIEDLAVTPSSLYVVELVGGPSRVRRIPLGSKAEPLAREPKKKSSKKAAPAPPVTVPVGARGTTSAELPILPISNVTLVERIGEDLLVRNESYLEPPAWYRYRAAEHRLTKTSLAKAPPVDMSDVEVLRDTCVSKDGTKVPLSILRMKGTTPTGGIPTLLTGYGGYAVSVKPRLRTWYRPFIEQGGVLAQANLRGGGELGEAWHRAGKLTQKQNVFDDFAACAQRLFDLGYTKPEKLAITGRSNGGLLMGASLVQHPEMFRAVVSGVGIYDMLRVELTPNGAFNVTEYGTVKDEAQFRALYAYSPFHNVKDGAAYPAMLFMTGANDPRVDPFHSRKMVARLQAASSSSNRPILLRASGETGHGMGTPLSAEIDEMTDMLSFLFRELDMKITSR